MSTKIRPHPLFRLWTPDEVAECMPGIRGDSTLYRELWACTEHYKKFDREDCGPSDVVEINSLSKFWSRFERFHQLELNRLAIQHERLFPDCDGD